MGALIRAYDWAASSLGPAEEWPQPLKTALRLILNTRHPMCVLWGPDLIVFYNDALRRSIGPERRDSLLGQPARVAWAGIWPIIGPQFGRVLAGKGAVWDENRLIPVIRHGRPEEAYWTYCYGPIDDETMDGGVAGVLAVCTETTEAVLQQRRQAVLLELSDRLNDLNEPLEIMAAATEALGRELRASRVAYAEADDTGTIFDVARSYTEAGAPALVGRCRLAEYGEAFAAELQAGRTLVVSNVLTDPRTKVAPGTHPGHGIAALIARPLIRGGRLRAVLLVDALVSRTWTPAEVKLVEEVAYRIWSAVEWGRTDIMRKQAEAELRLHDTELERLVEIRTLDLKQAQAALAQTEKLTALGQLAGGIAHDFNNIIQAIQGAAALIRRRKADPRAVDHLARMLEDAATRGASVTRRLLSFARKDELHAEVVNPARLLSDMSEVLAHTMGANIEIGIDLPPKPPSMLRADKGQLEAVMINLATNARDAMSAGGSLTLSARDETIAPDAGDAVNLPPGRYVRLEVADTGEGMSATVLTRACEPFFTTKPLGKGTGLGLAMARGFAEQSGGTLAIRGAPGLGTTVTIWLPAEASEAAGEPADDGLATDAPRPRERILVVDDEALVREVLAEGLEEHGFEVLRASDAPAALAMLDSGAMVDALLTDYAMPGMDGIALIVEARRRLPGLPALLLTGNADSQVESKISCDGVTSGAFTLLRKPVSAGHLAERIKAILEHARSETSLAPDHEDRAFATISP